MALNAVSLQAIAASGYASAGEGTVSVNFLPNIPLKFRFLFQSLVVSGSTGPAEDFKLYVDNENKFKISIPLGECKIIIHAVAFSWFLMRIVLCISSYING